LVAGGDEVVPTFELVHGAVGGCGVRGDAPRLRSDYG
jgi:hypothetical protein